MKLPIGVVGKIISGEELGQYVKIIDDHENTGGYLIFTSTAPDFESSYDCWVQDHESLIEFFKQSHWIVVWK